MSTCGIDCRNVRVEVIYSRRCNIARASENGRFHKRHCDLKLVYKVGEVER